MAGPNSAIIGLGREFNEGLMTGQCKITVPGAGRHLDRETGKMVDNGPSTLYQGKCKIRIAAASAGIMEREPLGQAFAVQESILSLPIVAETPDTGTTADLPSNADVEILANDDDVSLVGHHFRIKKYSVQSSATQRRIIVEDVG